jgi:L-2-hydroxycarboxylate dehydrogenase (NAD+)
METTLRFRQEDLLDFVLRYMTKLGVPEGDAKIVGEVLMSADIRGVESHRLHRLGSYYGNRIQKGLINPLSPSTIVKETLTSALIDGGNGCGQVVSRKAMILAIEKARNAGIGAVTVRNSNHFGIAGYYALMALREDMIGTWRPTHPPDRE